MRAKPPRLPGQALCQCRSVRQRLGLLRAVGLHGAELPGLEPQACFTLLRLGWSRQTQVLGDPIGWELADLLPGRNAALQVSE